MEDNSSIEEIRVALTATLTNPNLDISKVIALSAELARNDPDSVRFSTDAGIITRLGRELVAKHETAVAELIKNSYDADAPTVDLTFVDADWEGGTLLIEDTGLGMTRQQLVDGFMRLSSNDKTLYPYSPRYERRRAGQKGIGRFAVQRLGARLTIKTQTLESDIAFQVQIDWNQFESGIDLSSVANHIEEVPKEKPEGTTLIIEDLRDGWTEAAIRRVYRYVGELLQPFPLSDPRKEEEHQLIEKTDPGFKVRLIRRRENEEAVIASEEDSIFPYALAEIEAYVDGEGFGCWTMHSKQLEIDLPVLSIGKEGNDKEPLSYLRNASVKLYYFIWDADLLPRAMFSTLRELAQSKGGIRVYRNGFRVLPYGERGDDWINLDKSTRARSILPPHGNNNFFGFVQLDDYRGDFIETSSREGFLENEPYVELQEFCYTVIRPAVLRIAEARERKQTASQRDWKASGKSASAAIREAAEHLEQLANEEEIEGTPSVGNAPTRTKQQKQKLNTLAVTLRDAVDSQDEFNQQLLAENGMLRVLASLGLIIGEFTHEVRQTLGAAHLNARRLTRMLTEGGREHEVASTLFANIQRFWSYASYFDRAITENAGRELAPQNLRAVVRDFIETISDAAYRIGIQVEMQAQGNDLITEPMHGSELASILFNFYSNSQKAIRRARSKGKILVNLGEMQDVVYLEFSDNGDGVPPEHRERIFNAFFTTATPTGKLASEEDELQGTGLGLKIVKDIVEGYNGDIRVVSPKEGFATTIRIELPKNSESQDE